MTYNYCRKCPSCGGWLATCGCDFADDECTIPYGEKVRMAIEAGETRADFDRSFERVQRLLVGSADAGDVGNCHVMGSPFAQDPLTLDVVAPANRWTWFWTWVLRGHRPPSWVRRLLRLTGDAKSEALADPESSTSR